MASPKQDADPKMVWSQDDIDLMCSNSFKVLKRFYEVGIIDDAYINELALRIYHR